MKLNSIRNPHTIGKHIKLEAAAQVAPLSEYDLEDIDYMSALTGSHSPNEFARHQRALRVEDLNNSED